MASPTPEPAPGPHPFRGLLLTGGASRRFGSDKAFAPVQGEAMVRRVANALEAAGARDLRAVGGDRSRLEAVGLAVVEDRWPGEGPLGGLVSGLEDLARVDAVIDDGDELVVAAACDLPRLRSSVVVELVARLVGSEADVAVPVVDDHRQLHLLAIRRRATDTLAASFARGDRSLHRALADVGLLDVAMPAFAAALRDADTPKDLDVGTRVADRADGR